MPVVQFGSTKPRERTCGLKKHGVGGPTVPSPLLDTLSGNNKHQSLMHQFEKSALVVLRKKLEGRTKHFAFWFQLDILQNKPSNLICKTTRDSTRPFLITCAAKPSGPRMVGVVVVVVVVVVEGTCLDQSISLLVYLTSHHITPQISLWGEIPCFLF